MEPHSGVGGETPRPRKLMDAPVSMHMTTSEAAKTTAELMTLGSRWRNRIRASEKPATRAAWMNSESLSTSTSLRTSLA